MHIDLFDELCERTLLNKSSVFNRLDEFTVYCYYIEQTLGPIDIQVGDNFRSPLRKDDTNPSFRLYYGKDEVLYFTDYGNKNKSGDVLTFVATLLGITKNSALEKISIDFGLRSGEVTLVPIKKQVIKPKKELGIQIKEFTEEGLAFWNSFHITPITLKRYNVFEVAWILWDTIPMRPKQMAFAYRIGKYYKLYTPYDENHKFVTYYPLKYVEGLMQLRYKQKLLIITKSTKDVMVLAELGYEAISPQSESTVISRIILKELEKHYTDIVVFFDNDLKENSELYPYPKIYLPVDKAKDISDYARDFGLLEARIILTQMLYGR